MKLYLPNRLSLLRFAILEILKPTVSTPLIYAEDTVSSIPSLSPDKSLTGKLVVITGACTPAGRSAALKFANLNADLILVSPNEASLNEVQAACRMLGANVSTFVTNAQNSESNKNMIDSIKNSPNRIDLWINNAVPAIEEKVLAVC